MFQLWLEKAAINDSLHFIVFANCGTDLGASVASSSSEYCEAQC